MKEQWKKQMQQKMADYQESDIEVSWAEIEKALAKNRQQAKVVPLWLKRVAVAAVILLMAGGGYWTLFHHRTETSETRMADAMQTPNIPVSITDPVQPVIQKMMARVTQSVQHLYAVSDTVVDVTPMVVEESDTLTNTLAELEPIGEEYPEKDPATTETKGSQTHQEVTTHHSYIIYPSDLHKSVSSNNRLTAKVYLSNTMANSSQYSSSQLKVLNTPQGPEGHSWECDEKGDSANNGEKTSDGSDDSENEKEQETGNSTDNNAWKTSTDDPTYKTIQTSESVRHHQPIRFGFSLRYCLNERWSLESGLTYTRLTADITNTVDGKATATEQNLNYIGIPLNASYLLWGNRHFSFYLSAGGLVEKMVKGSRMTQGVTNSVSIHPLQISMNGAVGAEFKFTDGFSLYAEPALNYYFDNGSSIPTLYQEKPLNFNLNVGVRFNIK